MSVRAGVSVCAGLALAIADVRPAGAACKQLGVSGGSGWFAEERLILAP